MSFGALRRFLPRRIQGFGEFDSIGCLLTTLRNFESSSFRYYGSDEEDGAEKEYTTPWVRQVISGVDLLRNPKYNKGLAYQDEERDRLHIRGLIPPAILSQEVQVERILLNIRGKENNLDKFSYLMSLHERNETLFYRVMLRNFEEMLPIVHNPTVRMACRKYSLMFRSIPRGLFITLQDRGRVYRLLKNWPERRVKLIVVTDGEKVGPLLDPTENCDLGVQAMGVPVSKLIMFTTCGGIRPQECVPVCIDVGTDNEDLLNSPFYVGLKHRRVRGEAYQALLDEFLVAVKRRYGNTVLIQFVDMKHETANQLVNIYRSEFPCLHDGSQGRAAAMLSGILAAEPLSKRKLEEHKIFLVGEGEILASTAELIAMAIAHRTSKTVVEARENIWLIDEKGLVVRERSDSATLEEHKLPFLHSSAPCPDLKSAVEAHKPTVLIGCSFTAPAPFKFDRQICQMMAENTERPLIFPLSPANAECTAHDAYSWTDGRCIFADQEGSTSHVVLPNGQEFFPAQCHTTYIFPGIALGAMLARSNRLTAEQFIAAAEAVAKQVTDYDRARGAIFPPLRDIREIAAHVARDVALKSYETGTATNLPKPHNLLGMAQSLMYLPQYRTYR